MKKAVTSAFLIMLLASSANAALVGRLEENGVFKAYYDTVLNITWLADANYAKTSGYDADGLMTWSVAQGWIGTLNTANYLGVNGWRLPTVKPVNGSSFNYSYSAIGSTDYGYNVSEQGTAYAGSTQSEMAHLFYNTLGNKSYCDPAQSTVSSCSGPQAGWDLTNTGPFSNLQSANYWSGTEYAPATGLAWFFGFNYGLQHYNIKGNGFYAWAVRPGDIAPVPLPAAAWLFGGALTLLGALRRRAMTALG